MRRTAIVFLMTLFACDSSRIHEDNVEFPDRVWKVTEEPVIRFHIADTALQYNLRYNIRNSIDYPFSRIFVMYHLYDSTGKELSRKLLNNDLFDQKTGRPLGTSGIGDLYDHQFPMLDHYRFSLPGSYSVKLDQFMRQDTLQGVIAVGVRVEKAEVR